MKNKFTLIELIIVVAVIAILVTLLLPSLNNARYRAKLAVCMSNLSQMGRGSFLYASYSDNRFLKRDIKFSQHTIEWTAQQVMINPSPYGGKEDFRPIYRQMFGSLGKGSVIQCPLIEPTDLEGTINIQKVYMNYSFYGGWKYEEESRGFLRITDEIYYQGKSYDTLASDFLEVGNNWTFSNHPDKGKLSFAKSNGPTFLLKRYQTVGNSSNSNSFSKLDLNFLKLDGSVKLYQKVNPNDGRFAKIRREQINVSSGSSIYVPIKN